MGRDSWYGVRRMITLKKRALVALLLAVGCGVVSPAVGQTFNLSLATGLITPAFRDLDNLDGHNTTWWGWSSGTFGAPMTTVNDPAVTLGIGGLDGSIVQTSGGAIVSGSMNLYAGPVTDATIEFALPTNGIVGEGFTTILIQGRTAFGGFNADNPGVFGVIDGVIPEVVVANNAIDAAQFWVKYELAGNESVYTMSWDLNSFTSIAELTVDTIWSSEGFWSGTAVVPEPASACLLMGCVVALGAIQLRRRRQQSGVCK